MITEEIHSIWRWQSHNSRFLSPKRRDLEIPVKCQRAREEGKICHWISKCRSSFNYINPTYTQIAKCQCWNKAVIVYCYHQSRSHSNLLSCTAKYTFKGFPEVGCAVQCFKWWSSTRYAQVNKVPLLANLIYPINHLSMVILRINCPKMCYRDNRPSAVF